MMKIQEYDKLIKELRVILTDGTYCEDNKLRLRNNIKYNVYNLMCEHDKGFVKKLHKDLEYKECK